VFLKINFFAGSLYASPDPFEVGPSYYLIRHWLISAKKRMILTIFMHHDTASNRDAFIQCFILCQSWWMAL